ncbi:LytR family transcriptional regulator [Spongiactinospora gelatinilytica]|uniref:LytR family transcriptional regulator n=1 Tax=Spongiactinospora gelatinilytica TaxID=2666298 RepID=A0A2W2FYQ8_9ACTN|nr:LytR family transcriptional regulator [Spongiactinospora gelatinilytica]
MGDTWDISRGEQARVRERSRTLGIGAVIGWTLVSVVAPGAAHLKTGHRRTGFALLGVYAALLITAGVRALTADAGFIGRLTSPEWLTGITVGAVVLGLGWFAVIVHSFVVLRPGVLQARGQAITGVVAGLTAVAVLVPFAWAVNFVTVSRRTLDEVFDSAPDPTETVKPEDPWNGRDRLNVLLLGGDADDHRVGVRTDSINVASVDIKTGSTVLLSLPRNLENVRFPPDSPMHARFPDGFRLPVGPGGGREDLLFAVWEYADTHPEIFGGRKNQGARTLKETVGYTLGLKVDWFALVNMWGFARLIDAIGGVTLTVDRDVVFGKYNEGLVKAGTRKLGGADAMWFARSRTNSDDFTRMRRQRCVLGALLEQADPATVLARFNRVALATKELLRTDIPRPMLEHLVPVALRVKNAKVNSVQFVPPLINTGYPDWTKIRSVTAKAIRDSVRPKPARAAKASPETSADSSPKAAAKKRTPSPTTTGGGLEGVTGLTDGCSGG